MNVRDYICYVTDLRWLWTSNAVLYNVHICILLWCVKIHLLFQAAFWSRWREARSGYPKSFCKVFIKFFDLTPPVKLRRLWFTTNHFFLRWLHPPVDVGGSRSSFLEHGHPGAVFDSPVYFTNQETWNHQSKGRGYLVVNNARSKSAPVSPR